MGKGVKNLNTEVETLKNILLKSNWPKCNQIAEELFEIRSVEAKQALIEGLKGKRHHIRTASIMALTKFHDVSDVVHIKPFLNDPSYETRIEAKNSIKELTGEDVLTGRGE